MAHPKLLRYYDTIMSVKLKKKRVTLPKIGDMFSPKKAPPRRSATLSSLHTVSLNSLTAKHLLEIFNNWIASLCPCIYFPKMTIFLFLFFTWQLDRSAREFELGLEYGPPVLNINGQSWIFEDGQWMIRKIWAPQPIAPSTSVTLNIKWLFCCLT